MTKFLLFSIMFFLTFQSCYSQEIKCKKSLLIAHYNVENLFDTIDDPHKNDNEFLPSSEKKAWDSKKYWAKQQKIAYVIQQIDPKHLPDIITLVEIESITVLNDLVNQAEIKSVNYQIIHREGPDARGIDCAILYNPKSFKLIESKYFAVTLLDDNRFKTRKITYAKGLTESKDTLHIFANHWPSRSGGEAKSVHKRNRAAEVLRQAVDSILMSNSDAKIIILGDFNDETDNASIDSVLNAKSQAPFNPADLVNMSAEQDRNGIGTYHYYKTNEWNMLDQMIVTSNLLSDFNGGLMTKSSQMQIFSPDWILEKDKKGNNIPFKTYAKGYNGGYSDHLPIYQYFYWKCKLKKYTDSL